MNDQNIALIKQYLNKELNETELSLFKEKLEDEDFFKEVMIAKGIYETRLEEQKNKSNGAFEKAADLAKRLGEDLYSDVNLDWEYPIDLDVIPELTEKFNTYAPLERKVFAFLRSAIRASANEEKLNTNITQPINDTDYTNEIPIILTSPIESDISIRIYDNEGNKVQEDITLASMQSQLIISTTDFLPGLYYIRLKTNVATIFRKFYIQKHLMSDELKPDSPKER